MIAWYLINIVKKEIVDDGVIKLKFQVRRIKRQRDKLTRIKRFGQFLPKLRRGGGNKRLNKKNLIWERENFQNSVFFFSPHLQIEIFVRLWPKYKIERESDHYRRKGWKKGFKSER